MSPNRYDIVVVRTDRDGKARYTRIGAMFPNRDGGDRFSIKLDALPLPNEQGEVWLQVFPPREDGDDRRSNGNGRDHRDDRRDVDVRRAPPPRRDDRRAPPPARDERRAPARNDDLDDDIPF